MQTPTVLYDGACPVCRREINHYKKRRGAEGIQWIDISDYESLENDTGISYQQAMQLFHVRNQQGEWLTGAAAFVELWSHLRPYKLLAWLVIQSRTTALLNRAYLVFAKYRNRKECRDDFCERG